MRKKLIATFLAAGLLASSIPMSGVKAFEDDSVDTPDYFASVAQKKGYIQPELDLSYLYDSYANLPSTYADLPEKYDLRTEGRISPVRQQYFQDCWAISTNDAAGSSVIRQFPQLELAPEHTAKFAYDGEYEREVWPDFFGGDPSEDPFNSGGYSSISLGTMAAWKGPVTRNTIGFDYSWETPVIDDSLRNVSDFHLQDAFYFPVGTLLEDSYHGTNEKITKELIMTEGATTTSYLTAAEKLSLTDDLNWYNKNETSGDHEVTIVGWDDTYAKENFSCMGEHPEKDGAWLIRNSWGTKTGKDGYQWISYEDKTMGVSSCFILEDKNNYENIYQYDISGWSLTYGCKDHDGNLAPTGKAANIFTANGNEMLEAVSFYTTDVATEYSISVYTDVEDGVPENESVQLNNMTGTEMYAGYHTIELDTPVYLKAGTNFSIVVEFKNSNGTYQIPVEAAIWKSEEEPQYIGKGRSYVYDPYDGGWQSIAGNAGGVYVSSACIKGFTNPAPEEVTIESVTSEKTEPVNSKAIDTEEIKSEVSDNQETGMEYEDTEETGTEETGTEEISKEDTDKEEVISEEKSTEEIKSVETEKEETIQAETSDDYEPAESVQTEPQVSKSIALVSTVRFSNEEGPLIEGPVKDGEQVTLTSSGADGIIYKINDGSEVKQKVTPDFPNIDINIDFPEGVDKLNITACGYKNGTAEGEVLRGKEITKTFTKAHALLTDLSINTGEGYKHLNVKDLNGDVHEYKEIICPSSTNSIIISAQSADNITINGETFNKSVDGLVNYQEYTLHDGYNNFEIKVSGDGDSKIPQTYKFNVYKSSLNIDYKKEKISFDDNLETVYVKQDGKTVELKSGDSISEYIDVYSLTFDVKDKGGAVHPISIYGRMIDGSNIKINYFTEHTLQIFSSFWKSSFNPDMKDASAHEEGEFELTPGQDLYIQKEATDTSFESNIIKIEVPKRPEKPDVKVEQITKDSVKLTDLEGVSYGIDYVSDRESSLIENLKPDTEYIVKAYYVCTDHSFKSDKTEIKIKTLSESPDPEKPETDHSILEGKDQSVDFSKGDKLQIRIEGLPEELKAVYVDNKLVDKENYSVVKGSIVVTFTDEFVKTLSKGVHNLSFEFTNGQTLNTTFTVTNTLDGNKVLVDNNTPKTGDNLPFIGVWIASAVGALVVLVVAIAVIIGLRRNKKK